MRRSTSSWIRRAEFVAAIVVVAGSAARADTVTTKLARIDVSEPDVPNPLRGFYDWLGQHEAPQPTTFDSYTRYDWRELEPSQDNYDFSKIERDLDNTNKGGKKFAFRVMAVDDYDQEVVVPDYITALPGGRRCSAMDSGRPVFVPDWNSAAFIERARKLVTALGKKFDGNPGLAYVDIGIYGHWGEWHTHGLCDGNEDAGSPEAKRAYVDMHVEAFPTTRLLMVSGGGESVGFAYALGKSPRIGVRCDSLGKDWFVQQFKSTPDKWRAMQDRWKTAPFIAEFWGPGNVDFNLTIRHVSDLHVAAISNGNYGTWGSLSGDQQKNALQTAKTSGYRFSVDACTFPDRAGTGGKWWISCNWANTGVTPAYEAWDVIYDLKPSGASSALWKGKSKLDLQTLLPSPQASAVDDVFDLPASLPPGSYDVGVAVIDPSSVRPQPLGLATKGRTAQGRYPLGTLTIAQGPVDVGQPSSSPPPKARAGGAAPPPTGAAGSLGSGGTPAPQGGRAASAGAGGATGAAGSGGSAVDDGNVALGCSVSPRSSDRSTAWIVLALFFARRLITRARREKLTA